MPITNISKIYILYYFAPRGFLANARRAPVFISTPHPSTIRMDAHLQIVTSHAPQAKERLDIF